MPTDLNDPLRARNARVGQTWGETWAQTWADDPKNTLWGLLAMVLILIIGGFILYAPLTRQFTASTDHGAVANNIAQQSAPLPHERTPGSANRGP